MRANATADSQMSGPSSINAPLRRTPQERQTRVIDNPDQEVEVGRLLRRALLRRPGLFQGLPGRLPRSAPRRFAVSALRIPMCTTPTRPLGLTTNSASRGERISAPLRISIIAVDNMMSRKDTVDVHVDGVRQILLAPDEIETPDSINEYFIGPQDLTDGLIEAMKADPLFASTIRMKPAKMSPSASRSLA